MPRAKLEELRVTTFVATPDEVSAGGAEPTRFQPICFSPWCAPTVAATCRCAHDRNDAAHPA